MGQSASRKQRRNSKKKASAETPATTTEATAVEPTVATTEEPKAVEESKAVEEPKAVEETKAEETKVEETKAVEEPKVEESKAVEETKVEETKVEETKVEEPAVATTSTAAAVVATETPKVEEQEPAKTVEEPKAEEETVEAEPVKTATTTEEEQVVFNGSFTMTVSNHLHKYIIGPKGATIKNIQGTCGDDKIKIDLSNENNTVTLVSSNDEAILSAKHQIEEIIAPHKDKLNVDAMTESKTFKVPKLLHKYILGDKGSQMKLIQNETKSDITLNESDDTIIIKSTTQDLISQSFQMVLDTLEKVWWYYDASTETFTENTLTDRLFKQYRTKVNEQHELMSECYEKSKKAFEEGRKDEAKELSEQGKKHKELKEQYSQEAAIAIFTEMNKDKDEDSIDLHGLLVSEAVEFVDKRIQEMQESKKLNVLNVITGAGNHSEAEAKIKPMIAKLLDEKSLKYEKGNEGVFVVTLF